MSPPEQGSTGRGPRISNDPGIINSPGPVRITYKRGNESTPTTENFDFLVVACDPRNLNISDCTAFEEKVKKSLLSYTFFTSLFKAKRADHPELVKPNAPERSDVPNYGCRFDLNILGDMEGHIYGFRDEVMTRELNRPEKSGITYVTTYQLLGEPLIGSDPAERRELLERNRDDAIRKSCSDRGWIDFNPRLQPEINQDGAPEKSLMTDYFPHFGKDALLEGLPWQIRENQGKNNTAYISAFTCFESVLHLYLYGNWLMDDKGPLLKNNLLKKDSKIAIIGAGPSGLLFASQQLLKKGFTNFKIFESSDRIGGKSMTETRKAPTSGEDIPCELGTCYLSASYRPLMPLFSQYGAGNVILFDTPENFRSIMDREQARNDLEKENGVEFRTWVEREAMKFSWLAKAKLATDTIKYIVKHHIAMGTCSNDAMPDKNPCENVFEERIESLFDKSDRAERSLNSCEHTCEDLFNRFYPYDSTTVHASRGLDEASEDREIRAAVRRWFGNDWKTAVKKEDAYPHNLFTTTFKEYLEENELQTLIGLFTYGYQVQGYGPLDKIPAYYGLVWMTPLVLWDALYMQICKKGQEKGFARAVDKGWSELWSKIVEKDNLSSKIELNARIETITRK